MKHILKLFSLFLLLTGISCSKKGEQEVYTFSQLSLGQLVNLKKVSEQIEGFFLTTHATSFFTDRQGTPFYVCIRFLNDPTVNQKLKKSALPLLIQIGHQKTFPLAETVILLHPKNNGVFYYEESQVFQLASMPLILKNREYDIMDLHFSPTGKITQLYLKQKGVSLEKLNERNQNQSVSVDSKESPLVLKLSSFIDLSSDSCKDWPRLRYIHSAEIPNYLKVSYANQTTSVEKSSVKTDATGSTQSQSSPTKKEPTLPSVPRQLTIDENAPYRPAPKTN